MAARYMTLEWALLKIYGLEEICKYSFYTESKDQSYNPEGDDRCDYCIKLEEFSSNCEARRNYEKD